MNGRVGSRRSSWGMFVVDMQWMIVKFAEVTVSARFRHPVGVVVIDGR